MPKYTVIMELTFCKLEKRAYLNAAPGFLFVKATSPLIESVKCLAAKAALHAHCGKVPIIRRVVPIEDVLWDLQDRRHLLLVMSNYYLNQKCKSGR